MKPVMLLEPCRPYDLHPEHSPAPVDVWRIVDRLGEEQLRRLAVALAIHKPDVFEERILEFWARQPLMGCLPDAGQRDCDGSGGISAS